MSTVAHQAVKSSSVTAPGQNTRSRTDWAVLVLALVIIALTCLGQSAIKPFWYDELVTLRIAGLPTARDIIHFYETGKDTTSFLPALILYGCKHLPGKPEVVERLPFTFAYLVTALCLWLCIRRRYPTGYAAAIVFLLPQGTTLYFASETRAYAFVLMGTAIAMASWLWSTTSRSALPKLGVFVGLATAVLFHFFAIFLFVPFAVAEWYFMRSTGQRRWGMWLAIVLFPATLVIMVPNILAARQVYGHTFWSKPGVGLLMETYTFSVLPLGRDVAAVILLFAVFLWTKRGQIAAPSNTDMQERGFTKPEWVLLIGLSLIPVIAFIGSLLLGLFRSQYVLYFECAMLVLVVAGFAEVVKRRRRAGWAIGAVMFLLLTAHVRGDLSTAVVVLSGKPTGLHPAEYEPDLYTFLKPTQLPVVPDGALVLLPLDRYSPQDLKDRLVGLTSYRHALLHPKAITTDLNLEVFGPILKYPLQDYDAFIATHKDFLLVVNPRWEEYSWLFPSLLQQSETRHDVSLQLLYATAPVDGTSESVYLVHFASPGDPSAAATAKQ